ncbi:MAG: hypothetical protein E7514_06225 [Ruminococcaceae bacterium]|nr:hypothetical protein [Oscillospiraceae bacterium]
MKCALTSTSFEYDSKKLTCYGLISPDGEAFFDISFDRREVKELQTLIEESGLDSLHFGDAVFDFITEKSTVLTKHL